MKSLFPAALALALLGAPALAQPLAVQLKGPGLAGNAGFLLAEAQGLYTDAGLEVRLLPPSDAPPFKSLARGAADLTVEWMPAALLARENGLPLVNIGQILARPSLRLACRADAGIGDAAGLRGKSVASWFEGAELPLEAWLNRAGVPQAEVTLVRQSDGPEMLRQRQADCVSTRSFAVPDDADTAADTTLDAVSLDPGPAATLEDGLYALDAALADPAMRDGMARFLRASMAGWRAAAADPAGTARLLLGPDPDEGALARLTDALRGMSPLLGDGRLDDAAYRQTVEALRAGGADAVLRRAPENAFTHKISDLAAKPAGQASLP